MDWLCYEPGLHVYFTLEVTLARSRLAGQSHPEKKRDWWTAYGGLVSFWCVVFIFCGLCQNTEIKLHL